MNLILNLSIFMQVITIVLAFWLWTNKTKQWGWIFFDIAAILFSILTIRWGYLTHYQPKQYLFDSITPIIIVLISFFCLVGISCLLPTFRSMKLLEKKLQKHRQDLDTLLHKQILGLANSNIKLHKQLEEWYESEQRFQENEKKFHNIIQMTPMGIMMYELDENQEIILTGFNPAANFILGIDNQQFIGKRFVEIHPSLANTEFPERFRGVCLNGESWQKDQSFDNEKVFHGIYSFNAFQTSPGKMVVMFQDITSQKRAEEELRESEAKYRKLIETTFEGYCSMDPHGVITDVNQAFCRMSGYAHHETIGKPFFYFADEENQKTIAQQLCLLESTLHRSYELSLLKKNGKNILLHVSSTTLRNDQNQLIGAFAILSDITEERRTLNALQESEERLRLILESTQDGVWENDFENNKFTYSDRMFTMLGYTPSDIKDGYTFFSTILHPDDDPPLEKILKSLHPLHENFFVCEFRLRCKNGTWHYILCRGKCLEWNSNGHAARIIGTHTDITELKKLEEQLHQAHKMEAVGQLAGGVAHNINNLLTGVIGNLQLAAAKDTIELQTYYSNALSAANRAAKLVKDLLAFSRKSSLELKNTDINHVIDEIFYLIRETFDRRIEIRKEVNPALPSLMVDSSQIHSILMNLCINARDAIDSVRENPGFSHRHSDSFQITVKSSLITIDESCAGDFPQFIKGDYVAISVSDNGIGIDADTQKRIFEPFYTTKESVGTGLGLASAFGIVKQHNGWINFTSSYGEGSSFCIYFPVPVEVKTEQAAESSNAIDLHGNETILIVDDEDLVLDLAKEILHVYGYSTLTATDGLEALDVYEKNREQIDLILLDLSMPKLSGKEVIQEITFIDPKVKIIISSGYLEDSYMELIRELGIKDIISKPYNPEELAIKIRKVLNQPH